MSFVIYVGFHGSSKKTAAVPDAVHGMGATIDPYPHSYQAQRKQQSTGGD
jgi:hypothetical protein